MKRLFRFWGREAPDRELEEEVETHLALRAEALEAEGLPPEEARREAERRFGDVERLRASARRRDRRLGVAAAIDGLHRDVTLALRRAARSPGTAALQVAIFALGVGLTAGTFTLVDRVLLRPLPLPEPDRLVVFESVDSTGHAFARVSMANWWDWREAATTVEATGLHNPDRFSVGMDDREMRVDAQSVAGEFFQVVRMPLLHGRFPTWREIQSGEAGVVVSEGLWQRLLGGDSELRRPLRVSGEVRPVVGVVPAGSAYPAGTQLWVPRRASPGSGRVRNSINWHGVARLSDGASPDELVRELEPVARGIRETDPEAIYSYGVGIRSLHEFVVGDARDTLWLLMGSVLAVLLVAAVNLAALNLAGATARLRESAVRRALGAGRLRLIREEVVRHLLTALVGGAVGAGMAAWGIRALLATAGASLPRSPEIGFDARIALFAVGVSLLAGLVAGLVPALRSSTARLDSVRSGGGEGVGSTGGKLLVAVEVALAVLLLTGGGLLVRDLAALLDRDLGYDVEPILVAETTLTGERYREDHAARTAWWEAALRRVGSMSGVEAVAVANAAPTGHRVPGFIRLEGREPLGGAGYNVIAGGYFETLGIPVLEGRRFGPEDGPGTERVTIVNRSLVEEYWPDGRALGRRLQAVSMESFGRDTAPWLTVVGVVDDIRQWGFQAEPEAEMYVLASQMPVWAGTPSVLVRSRGGAEAIAEPVEEAVRELDASLAVETVVLADLLSAPLARQRFTANLVGAFGALATLLACLGVYGLLAFSVSRRTRELGVRAALGARRSDLVGMVLGSAVRIALAGTAAGLAGAWWLRDLVEPQLAELSPGDPLAFAGAGVLILVVSVLAAFRPAWRAASMDPREALREA